MTLPPSFDAAFLAESILRTTGDGLVIFSDEFRITWANERAEHLLRAARGALAGRQLFSYLRKSDVDDPGKDWDEFFRRQIDSVRMRDRNDLVVTRNDGTKFNASLGADWLDDRHGLLTVAEVDSRTALRSQVSTLSHQYEDLFQAIPIAVWEIDARRIVDWLDSLPCPADETEAYLLANHAEIVEHLDLLEIRAVNQAGLRQLSVESGNVEDLIAAWKAGIRQEAAGGFAAQLHAIRNRVQSMVTEGVNGTPDGDLLDVEIHQFIPRGPDGLELERVIVTEINISRAKATEAALKDAVDARDRLISSVAHELRTPLTVVNGLLHALAETGHAITATEAQELLGLALAEAADLDHLIDDLLAYSRQASGDWHISPMVVSFSDLVAAIEVRDEDGSTPLFPFEGDAMAIADPHRVRQIVRNLITNAVRYGGETIRIRAWENEWAHLEVSDDGAGLGSGAEKVFEPYQRGHETATRPASLGLGLTISKGLAVAMGGSLEYERSDDGWTTFRLTLPRAGAEDQSGRPSAHGD